MLCLVAGAGVLVIHLLGNALPVPVRLTVLAAFGLGALCLLVALFVFPGGGCDDGGLGVDVCDSIDFGRGVGYWLALLASIGGTALAFLRLNAQD